MRHMHPAADSECVYVVAANVNAVRAESEAGRLGC